MWLIKGISQRCVSGHLKICWIISKKDIQTVVSLDNDFFIQSNCGKETIRGVPSWVWSTPSLINSKWRTLVTGSLKSVICSAPLRSNLMDPQWLLSPQLFLRDKFPVAVVGLICAPLVKKKYLFTKNTYGPNHFVLDPNPQETNLLRRVLRALFCGGSNLLRSAPCRYA